MPQTPPKIPYNSHPTSITSLPTPNDQNDSQTNNQDENQVYSEQSLLQIPIDMSKYTQKEKKLFDVSDHRTSTMSQLDYLTGVSHISTLWLEKPENIPQIDTDPNILKDQGLFDGFIANIRTELQELDAQLKNKDQLSNEQISALKQKYIIGTQLAHNMAVFSNNTLMLHRFIRNQIMGHISP